MQAKRASIAAVGGLLLVSCRESSPGPSTSTSIAPPASASVTAPSASAAPPPPRPSPLPIRSSAPLGSAPPAASAAIAGMTLEKPIDLATGSYAVLGAAGLVIRKRDGSFLVARLEGKPASIEDDGKDFSRGHFSLVDRE